jgi:hypothetical protein
MKYENNYAYFFDKKGSVVLDKQNRIQKPVNMPKEIFKLVQDELRKLEDNGLKTSYNDYVLYALISMLNINRGLDNELKIGNKMNLEYYLNSVKKNKKE